MGVQLLSAGTDLWMCNKICSINTGIGETIWQDKTQTIKSPDSTESDIQQIYSTDIFTTDICI